MQQPPVQNRPPFPKGAAGAVLGAVGLLAALPLARRLGDALFSAISLPGAERVRGDVKAATYAEVALLVVGLPVAALLFGRLIPTYLERGAARGRLSFEWLAAGFALSFPLWMRGLRPKWALGAGVLLSAAIAVSIWAYRASFGFRRVWTRRGRRAALSVAGSGAAAALAWRAHPSSRAILIPDLTGEVVLLGGMVLAIALLSCSLLPRRFGGIVGLERMAGVAVIGVALSGSSLIFSARAGALVAVAALAPLVSLGLPVRWRCPRVLGAASGVFFFFCCGWTIYRQPSVAIDVFEDGHALGFAQEYLLGGRPYLDTYPVHGWGDDGGVDAWFFRVFGATLETFRNRRAAWTALTAAALAAAVASLFRDPVWSGLALLAVVDVCPWLSERQLLAFAALAVLSAGARATARRGVSWFLAGILGGTAILFSLDIGMILVLGALLGIATLPSAEAGSWEMRRGAEGTAKFLLGVGFGCLPFLVRLWLVGSLGAFLRVSFVELPREIVPVWGLPAGSMTELLAKTPATEVAVQVMTGRTVPWLFSVLVLTSAFAVLLWRAASASLDAVDRAAWVWAWVAMVSLRGTLGRADQGHAAFYGVFAAPLALWLFLRAVRSPRRFGSSLVLGSLLLVRFRPLESLRMQLETVSGSSRIRAQLAASCVPMFRTGKARVPIAQAEKIASLRQFVDDHLAPEQTFFDFSNEPALYFLFERRMPTRFLSTPSYETPEKQDEVVADLERVKPPLAILSGNSWLDAPDGVSNRDRAPRVAAYLDSHYGVTVRIASWTIAHRR